MILVLRKEVIQPFPDAAGKLITGSILTSYVLEENQKWCCKLLEKVITEDMAEDEHSRTIEFIDWSWKTGHAGIYVGWKWNDEHALLSYCPFCGERIDISWGSTKTFRRVEKVRENKYFDYVEVDPVTIPDIPPEPCLFDRCVGAMCTEERRKSTPTVCGLCGHNPAKPCEMCGRTPCVCDDIDQEPDHPSW